MFGECKGWAFSELKVTNLSIVDLQEIENVTLQEDTPNIRTVNDLYETNKIKI